MAYTTGSEVSADIATPLADADIDTNIIPEAEAAINAYVGRDFYVHTATENFGGDGGYEIVLSKYPLISIVSFTIGTTPVNSADYLIRGNVITLITGRFHRGRLNVEVTYAYGYATVPLSVSRACRLLAINYIIESQRENYEKAVDDDLAEVSYDGYSKPPTLVVQKDSTGDEAVDRLLEPYRLRLVGAV